MANNISISLQKANPYKNRACMTCHPNMSKVLALVPNGHERWGKKVPYGCRRLFLELSP